MGFKNLKEHFRIGHIVQVVPDKGICIGSPYIHDIIVVGFDGTIRKHWDGGRNDDLDRYVRDLKSDPAKVRELIEKPDTFTASIPVYTYDGAEIIERKCEQPGWPNLTHDGFIMYENTYSTDKEKVVGWAKNNARIGLKWAVENLEKAKATVAECEAELAEARDEVAKLDADYPAVELIKA